MATNEAVQTEMVTSTPEGNRGEIHNSSPVSGDTELLAQLGYKQELRRNFSTFEVFGIAFSIISLLPSIASTLTLSIPAGPVGMVWGWFIASGLIMCVGVAMADLASSMPTSGGLYWWTHFFASPKWRNPLCFLVGYSNTLGLVGCLCSVDYGFSLMFLSVIVIARDGDWTPSNGTIYGVFLCVILLHALLATTMQRVMNKLQTISVVMNLILIAATMIALPVGKHLSSERNSAKYIFTQTENFTTWPTGWAFMLAWMSPIWTIGDFDSCVHMSEEALNAAKAVPYGIMSAIGASWILGFLLMIVIAACINPDLNAVLGSQFGQPMAQIYFDAVGKHGAMGMMALLFLCQFQMGLSTVSLYTYTDISSNPNSYPIARSRIPSIMGFLSRRCPPIQQNFQPNINLLPLYPVRTVWGCAIFGAILGLLCLIAPAAANALFSLCVAGNNLAWLIPIFCRIWWGDAKFKPGPFYTGRLSKPIAYLAVAFLAFGICLAMFPTGGPNPTPQTMNYTVVINCTVWGGSLIYYYVDARNWFKGPKITLNLAELTEAQTNALREEGLEIEGLSERDETDGEMREKTEKMV